VSKHLKTPFWPIQSYEELPFIQTVAPQYTSYLYCIAIDKYGIIQSISSDGG
jgi:hypothetical protein